MSVLFLEYIKNFNVNIKGNSNECLLLYKKEENDSNDFQNDLDISTAKTTRYKFVKRKNNFVFFLINLLAFFNFIFPILSDLSITINTYINYNGVKIINIEHIGKPLKIYLDNNQIQTNSKFDYRYESNYLKIKTTNWIYNNDYFVRLVWKSDIEKYIENEMIGTENLVPVEPLEIDFIIPKKFRIKRRKNVSIL